MLDIRNDYEWDAGHFQVGRKGLRGIWGGGTLALLRGIWGVIWGVSRGGLRGTWGVLRGDRGTWGVLAVLWDAGHFQVGWRVC